MNFRWKLLILLIVIAILPIVAMRTFGAHAARSLAAQLISQSRQDAILDAKSRLALLIDSYSRLIRQKRMQLEMALLLQAEEVERALAADQPTATPLFREDFTSSGRDRLDLVASAEHAPLDGQKQKAGAMVSFSHQVFDFKSTTGGGQSPDSLQAARLTAVTPFLTKMSEGLDGTVLWHVTALKKGLSAVYPGHGGKEQFDPFQQLWYTQALTSEHYFWSEQFRDPFSGRSVMALSMPVKDSEGLTIGVTALMISTGSLLESEGILKHLPAATQSFLVGLIHDPSTGSEGAKIFASQAHGGADSANWSSQAEGDWLVADDPELQARVIDDFEHGRSNVLRVRYKDCDCLWVYGPLHQNAFLLLTTPYRQILKPIDDAEGFIQARIDELLRVTRYGIMGILFIIGALAFAFARTVTRPMQILAQGARRLAQGRFDTRVEIRSGDEFGEMGKVFNAVGPQLEAHARFQQTMELAREVQQHFLPNRPPEVPGLDIAGKSQYCEQIGGDYFDFIDPDDGSNRIAVVIGDVSGHGIPSALLMTTARALLRQRLSLPGSIRQVIADVNVRLCRDIEESGQFMTLFYAELQPKEMTLRWVRAGHDPALLYHPDTDRFEELMGEGTTLGVSCDVRFEEYRRSIRKGQILLLYTDGIREARNPDGKMFGNAPIKQIVRAHALDNADTILAAIMDELASFRGPQAKLEDDVTLVVVKML